MTAVAAPPDLHLVRLHAVRFECVGASKVRFDDLSYSLLRDGVPSSTLVRLENSGGKTTQLALLASTFLPERTKFLKHDHGQHFDDYVLDDDVSHVASEWEGPFGRRVIGQVAAWKGRQSSSDHTKLSRTFYSFEVIPGGPTLASLPVFDSQHRRRTMTDYLAELRMMCGDQPLTATTTQSEWAGPGAFLDSVGLNPGLLEQQLQMNAQEGGAGALLRKVADSAGFIRLALSLVSRRDRIEGMLEKMRATASSVVRRPDLQHELRFGSEAVPLLDAAASQAGLLADVTDSATSAVRSASTLHAALRARHDRDASRVVELKGEARIADVAVRELQSQRQRHDELEKALRRWADHLRVEEMQKALQQATDRRDAARAEADAVALIPRIQNHAALRAAIDELDDKLADSDRKAGEARARRDAVGADLAAASAGRLRHVEGEIEKAEETLRSQSRELAELQAEAAHATQAMTENRQSRGRSEGGRHGDEELLRSAISSGFVTSVDSIAAARERAITDHQAAIDALTVTHRDHELSEARKPGLRAKSSKPGVWK